MNDRVAHWYRQNSASRLPRRVITLDSESYSEFDGLTQTQSFRLAVATLDCLDDDAQPEQDPEWFSTVSTGDLWKWVAGSTKPRLRTVLFAHNLSYDLRITEALKYLPELGFNVHSLALSDYGCWIFLRNGDRSLYLIDSHSHIPASMEKVATALARTRPKLPKSGALTQDWERRCHADVSVLREAILHYLSLLRKHNLGDFRTTGAGQSSAAFRHRFLSEKTLLVHADTEALSKEREACWAGRSEIWKHGAIDGPLYEYDYDAAYARIALDNDMPTRLIGPFFPSTWTQLDGFCERYRVMIDADIDIGEPVVPTSVDGRIAWPTGQFRTTLWDCEFREVWNYGVIKRLHSVWCYDKTPLLHDWATWILDSLAGNQLGETPLGKIIAKEWSRSLIGRFGLRYPKLEREGELPNADLILRPVTNLDENRSYTQLQVGRTLYEQSERVESPNSCPAVMGYVMALSRIKLWRTMLYANFDNLVSVDTDGLIVNQAGADNLAIGIQAGDLPGLRLKNVYQHADLRGPRNMDLENQRRVSGVPKKAERIAPGEYRGEVWESLTQSLRQRRANTVTIRERTFSVSDRDPRRDHLPDGETCALVL